MHHSGCCHHTEGKVLFEVEFSAVEYLGLFQFFSTLSAVCSLTVSGFCSSMSGIQFIFSCHYVSFTTTYANFSVNHVMLLILAKVFHDYWKSPGVFFVALYIHGFLVCLQKKKVVTIKM